MAINTTISTTRYVPPGSYIAQIITPEVVDVPEDSLVPCYIGKGSRLMEGKNTAIRRSYVYEEELVFPSLAPYRAVLDNYSDGNMDMARLYTSNGIEVQKDQWRFIATAGNYNIVEVNVEIFDDTATYLVDYQSTSRSIPDILPIDEIRTITNVGDQADTSQYKEYTHYYIAIDITGPTAAANTPHVSTVEVSTTSYVSGTGSVVPSGTVSGFVSTYTDIVNRQYSLEVTNVDATSVTFEWSTPYADFTYGAQPSIPFASADTRTVTLTGLGAGPATGTVFLEHGVSVMVVTTTATPSACIHTGNTFNFSIGAVPLFERDLRYTNTNQFSEIDSVSPASANTGTAVFTINSDSDYTGNENATYHLYCYDVSGNHAWVAWQRVGQYSRTSGTFHVNHTGVSFVSGISLNSGVYLDATSGVGAWFAVGDMYTFNVRAPKIFYQGKDDRETHVVLTVATAAGTTATNAGYASANTPEGNYETITTKVDTSSVDPEDLNGMFVFKNNLIGYFKNSYVPWPNVNLAANRFTGGATGDNWTFEFTNTDLIYWDLNEKTSENFNSDQMNSDVFGNVTGTPNTKYIILDTVPVSITSVVNASGTALVLNTDYYQIANTAYLYFANTSATNAKLAQLPLQISYVFRSAEPNPGDLYYITANYLRPDSYYNVPILHTSRATAREFLAPAAIDNDLYIMSEIAWDNWETVGGAFYTIQVKDSDGDGVYSNNDFYTAIDAAEAPKRIADIIVLNKWSTLAYTLKHINKMADPFVRRHRMGWFGMPKDTPIGNYDTVGSLAYTARRTLQVYGSTPAHGTRILVGSTYGKREITLSNGVTAEVTLDGSFIAGALSALVRGFPTPTNDILRKQIAGFSFIQTYGDVESIENKELGTAQILYFTDIGSGVYRIEEDTTVDNYAQDFQLIMNMVQKQYVTRYMNAKLDNNLVSIVTPSAESAIILTQGYISELLNELVSNNYIAQYQDEAGNIRALDQSTDIKVYADTNDKTKLNFIYAYYLHGVIKRLFGTYTVDKSLAQLGVL